MLGNKPGFGDLIQYATGGLSLKLDLTEPETAPHITAIFDEPG